MIASLSSPRRSRRALVGALLALGALGGGTAFAASLTIASSKQTEWHSSAGCIPQTLPAAPADADSYVDDSNQSSNFGTATDLKVRAALLNFLGINLGGDRYTLVRFELPSMELCSVTTAKLRLYASSAASGRTLEALRVTGSWTEAAVTWANKPSTTSTGSATTSSGSGWREWTVTSQVTSMYSGTNNGFLVRDTSGALLAPEQLFSSREAASNHPELVITLG